MRAIITGTPRSGTKFTAAVLNACGVPTTHEHAFVHDRRLQNQIVTQQWIDDPAPLKAEVSWFVWPIADEIPDGALVFHQVREPWACIDSLASRCTVLKDGFRGILHAFAAVPLEGNPHERAARLYCRWNEECGRLRDKWFHVEMIRDEPEILLEVLIEMGVHVSLRVARDAIRAADNQNYVQRERERDIQVYAARMKADPSGPDPARNLTTRLTREQIEPKLTARTREAVYEAARRWGYS